MVTYLVGGRGAVTDVRGASVASASVSVPVPRACFTRATSRAGNKRDEARGSTGAEVPPGA